MSELSQAAQVLTGTEPTATDPAEERTDQAESQVVEEQPPEAEPQANADNADEGTSESEAPKQWEKWMYDLEIPGTDGLTAGEFKDRIKELQTIDDVRAQAEVERQDAQNEALQARETLKTLVSQMGLQLTPQQIEQAQRFMGQTAEQNDRQAAETIPGWDDPATRATGQAANAELLQQYGFSAAEAGNARDWRFQRMVNDFVQLRQRVQAAVKGEVKPKVKQAPRKVTQVSGESNPVADFKAGKLNQQQAVARLLTGGNK
jgi:hypothetical protein